MPGIKNNPMFLLHSNPEHPNSQSIIYFVIEKYNVFFVKIQKDTGQLLMCNQSRGQGNKTKFFRLITVWLSAVFVALIHRCLSSVKGLCPYRHASRALDRALHLCAVTIKTLYKSICYAARLNIYFSIGVLTPKFRCNLLVL